MCGTICIRHYLAHCYGWLWFTNNWKAQYTGEHVKCSCHSHRDYNPFTDKRSNKSTTSRIAKSLLCKQVLAASALADRLIHLKEPIAIAWLPEEVASDQDDLQDVVDLCGSFLIVRNETIYYVHQSVCRPRHGRTWKSLRVSWDSMVPYPDCVLRTSTTVSLSLLLYLWQECPEKVFWMERNIHC